MSGSRCVEPQPTLMSMPSQSQLIATTSAPSRRNASGVATAAAPCPQSTAIVSPARSPSTVATACAM